MKNKREDLVSDKKHVQVTTKPLCDLHGSIKCTTTINTTLNIPIFVKITIQDFWNYTMNPLYENQLFELDQTYDKENECYKSELRFRAPTQFGHHFYPILFKFLRDLKYYMKNL